MIKFFYFCYNINSMSTSLVGIYTAKVARKLTTLISTVILPIYFYYVRLFVLPKQNKLNNDIIVTLTSFPARIQKLYQVIISLMLQNSKPSKIILYLSKEQFSSMNDVPNSLQLLIPYGLKIIFADEDMRSYKKYIYNNIYCNNKDFIIVDDDIIYHPKTIDILLDMQNEFPNCVCANRCTILEQDKEYKYWKLASERGIGPLMATGCAGVYYPSNSLHSIAYDKELVMSICPDGDDIWLKASSNMKNTNVVYTGFNKLLLPVVNKHANDLHVENVKGNRNDKNIENVKELFMSKFQKDIFKISE